MTSNFLIFGGTSLAKQLSEEICQHKSCNKIFYSLAGIINKQNPLSCDKHENKCKKIITIYNSFSNENLFKQFIKSNDIQVVIDALHPFANKMREKIYLYSAWSKILFFSLKYPMYQPINGESWISVATNEAIVDLILKLHKNRPFFALGVKQIPDILEKFCQIDPKITLIFRSITKINTSNYNRTSKNINLIPIFDKPAKDLKTEINLFNQMQPDIIIAKNSGLEVFIQKVKIAHKLKVPLIAIENNKNITSYSQQEIINLLLINNLL